MSESLADALALSTSRMRSDQIRAWGEALPAALDEAAPPPAEAANLIVEAIIFQLERSESEHALLASIEALARRADLGETFARTLAARIFAAATDASCPLPHAVALAAAARARATALAPGSGVSRSCSGGT